MAILTHSQRQTLLALAGVVHVREEFHSVPGLEKRGLVKDGTITAAGQAIVDKYLAEKRERSIGFMKENIRRYPSRE